MHALGRITPGAPILGVRAGEVVVAMMCEPKSEGRTISANRKATTTESWGHYWSGEGLPRIKVFGLPVHRALVAASASCQAAVQIAACRILAAWASQSAEQVVAADRGHQPS